MNDSQDGFGHMEFVRKNDNDLNLDQLPVWIFFWTKKYILVQSEYTV